MKQTEYILITLANHTKSELESIENICVNWVESARYNNDKTKCILKIQYSESEPPSNVLSLTRYSASEIKKILEESEWQMTSVAVEEPAQSENTTINTRWTGSSPSSVSVN